MVTAREYVLEGGLDYAQAILEKSYGSNKAFEIIEKIKELIDQRKVLDAQADVFHKELTDLAKKSQDLHAAMIEKVSSVKKDKAEADGLQEFAGRPVVGRRGEQDMARAVHLGHPAGDRCC